jgi:type IV secretion system protein VirB6
MFRFRLIAFMLFLSGCGEPNCIKPEGLSGLREKSDIVSTGQKWVDSSIKISDKTKVTEINIIPSRINFCPNLHEDFTIGSQEKKVKLPFELKKNDKISFSVIGIKGCKSNEEDEKLRHVKIDEKCGEEETEHFARVLNQEECKDGICPNKYQIDDTKWLDGKEYWSSDFPKSDQDEKEGEITNIINSIKQGQRIDCSKLSESHASKIDTYILNSWCNKVCNIVKKKNCIQTEIVSLPNDSTVNIEEDGDNNKASRFAKLVIKEMEKGTITYIPHLKFIMAGEEFKLPQNIKIKYTSNDHSILESSILTNYDYTMENNHLEGEEFTVKLDHAGKGGYNLRVTKHSSLEDSLYIHVSDKIPEHKPGEKSEDISVDINKIYEVQYMEDLREMLKSKSGTIYYGVRDHGCDYKNEGEFNINVTTKEPCVKTFSVIYDFFDKEVKTAFFGSNYQGNNTSHTDLIDGTTSPTRSLYQSFVASNRTNTIRSTIVALLVLYIVLYTLYYFFGLTHLSIYEFLIVCLKIGVIAQLLQDNSWNFFYDNAFSMFVNGPQQLIDVANFRGTTSNVFEFLDLPLSRFLSSHSVLLIISLIFSGPLGIVAFCLVIWGLITVVLSIFNALFSYITSIAIIALLLSLAPIFITCVLFSYTREMFKKWIGYLVRFSIHPMVLLIFISLISQAMDYIVYSVFDFEVCSICILPINFKIFDFCIFYGYASKSSPNITAMFAFIILGHAMKALIKASSEISDSLSSSYVGSEPSQQYKQDFLGGVGLDKETTKRREVGGGATSSPSSSTQRPQRPQIPQRPGAK